MKKKLTAVLLASLFLMSAVLTGCGSKSNSASAKAPKILYLATSSDPRGMDPAWVDDGESTKVMNQIYETLFKYKKDSTEVEPCLATDWQISTDGKEYTFHLRKGVKFQDGTPFNADAVVYNIERQLPPKAKDDMPYASFTFGEVQKVEKVDDYTVKFTLKEPYTPFLANLAMALAAPIASPTALQKNNDNINENPVGTGPYKFVKWDKGQSITLERNTDYWGAKPDADKIIFKIEKENSVRASDLIAGQIDMTDEVDPNDIPKLQQNNITIFKDAGMNINYMAFNCSRAPFNNPKLREAISHAINRDELVKYLYQGYAEVANSPLPSFIPGYDDKVQPYNYDPDKAKQMLKDLGMENLTIKMITYSNARPYNPVNGQKLAEAVQNYLTKVGIKSTIETYQWTDYKQKAFQGEGDIMFYGWIGDNGDADNFLSLFDSKEISSSLNTAKYSNPEVDKLLAEARTTPNGDARNNLYKQIQEIVAKDAPWLPISHAVNLGASASKISGFYVHRTGSIFLKDVTKAN